MNATGTPAGSEVGRFSESAIVGEDGIQFTCIAERTPCPQQGIAFVFNREELSDGALVRLQSKCCTADSVGSQHCDCKAQRSEALQRILQRGSGVLIELDQEGRGHGISAKLAAYQMMAQLDIDSFEAFDRQGLTHDARVYDSAVALLRHLGLHRVIILTNNPAKTMALRAAGLEAHMEPLSTHLTAHNYNYLKSKQAHGHILSVPEER